MNDLQTRNNGNGQLQTRPDGELRRLLAKCEGQIKDALPRHLTPERMIRMALTVFNKTPGLQRCTPLSIVACVIQASELGLELSGPLGHAWMVPYKDQATFQVGYRGFFELAFRTGKVSAFPMRTVHANDVFDVRYGTNQTIDHRPCLKDRGDSIGYYSVIYLKDGGRDLEFMSLEDVRKHRDQYVKNIGGSSPWVTAFDAMAMKTTVRRLAKRVPLSTEIQTAVGYDEYAEAGILDHRPTPAISRTDSVLAHLESRDDNDQGPFTDEAPAEPERARTSQLSALRAHAARLGWGEPDVAEYLNAYGVATFEELSADAAEKVMVDLAAQKPVNAE